MLIVYSKALEKAIRDLDEEGVRVDLGAADATVVEDVGNGEVDLFESGFALAMKAREMGSRSEYIGARLTVFKARVDDTTVFMVGASEDEVLGRARSFRVVG